MLGTWLGLSDACVSCHPVRSEEVGREGGGRGRGHPWRVMAKSPYLLRAAGAAAGEDIGGGL